MIKKVFISLVIMVGFLARGQEQGFYMPYQMPSYAAVKFHTYVMNPSFPLLGYKEQNVGLYYRSQWMGYKDPSFSLMGASYGNKWNDASSANVFVYKRTAGVMSNVGAVMNYGHQVFFSDEAGMRFGLNVIPMYSGMDVGKMVAAEKSDPLLVGDKSFGFSATPGFDINYREFHFGVSAENIFDYTLGNKKKITTFADKSYAAHFMYRKELDGSGMMEGAIISGLVRGVMESGDMGGSGSVLLDMPKLGWGYVGFNMNSGVFSGIGFNFREMYSVGFEYENGIGGKIPELKHTMGVYVNVQFGGDRQKNFKPYVKKEKPKPAPKRELEKIIEPPKPPVDPQIQLAMREDSEAASVIPPGYYIIANVYQNEQYAQKFKNSISQTFSVSSFVHPKNNMTYIYIKMPVFDLEAVTKFYNENKDNPIFPAGIWIMNVTAKKIP